jgi:hypothetical protein
MGKIFEDICELTSQHYFGPEDCWNKTANAGETREMLAAFSQGTS